MTRAVLLILAVLLAAPAAAQATIVPQQGMKGVRIGMTVAQVEDRLGEPSRSRIERNEIIGRVRELDYGLTSMSFDGTKASSKLLTIGTTSRTERLANGIGIGSTRAAVDSKVARTRCAVEFGLDHCYIGSFTPGRIVTDFIISTRGKVKRIIIGRVVD